MTLNELVQRINEILGKNIAPSYHEERLGDIKHSFASIERAKEMIGFEPVVSFIEGLKKTIDW